MHRHDSAISVTTRTPRQRLAVASPLRLVLPIIALAGLAAILSGCYAPQSTFEPSSDSTQRIHSIYIYVIVAASIVGFLVLVGLAYTLIRYRARPGRRAEQFHGHVGLEIAWTVVPILILISIALPTIIWIIGTQDDPDPDVLEVTAVGHQWWFEFRYPGLGPDGADVVTANELRVPVGRQVAITLHANDVIHSFWVPRLVGKTDMVPGNTNKLEKFTPTELGVFYGQCAEFCGVAHALMRFRVHVETHADFDRWVASMNAGPSAPTPDTVEAAGKRVFELAGGCGACHAIEGVATGEIGPNLTLFGSRATLGAGILDNTDYNLKAWVSNIRDLKPIPEEGTEVMPTFYTGDSSIDLLTEAQVDQVVAYLKSLTY